MGTAGRVGLWLLVVGGGSILIELLVMVGIALRVRRTLMGLRKVAVDQASWFQSWRADFRLVMGEFEKAIQPFRVAQRTLRHPLVGLLLRYALRRRRLPA